MNEEEAWHNCHPDDAWIFDKLILSKKLGYQCGPVGVEVPAPDNYIVRPCINIAGMGIGAKMQALWDTTDHLPVGHFWCEIFKGRHLSADYEIDPASRSIQQGLTVEGFRDPKDPIWKFNRWVRVKDQLKINFILKELKGSYKAINCEFIDGKLIEMHLRANEDMGDYNEVIPIWEGQSTTPPKGFTYVEQPDYNRIGFFKR
jgi:hypothetical protein|tara:strand:- start:513 stop:1118 length:606 start_codon:yes stop_codon:yes gene_type:complete